MKKLEILLLIVFMFFSVCLTVKAAGCVAPNFGHVSGSLSTKAGYHLPSIVANDGINGSSSTYAGYDSSSGDANDGTNNSSSNNGVYPNQYIQNFIGYIYSRSLCAQPVESKLKGRSVSPTNDDTRFYLVNSQIWKQYVMFGGQIIENTSLSYSYSSYSNVQPKVKIYRDQSYGCKIMIDDKDTGIYVYREI